MLTISRYILYFMFYSLLGWTMEVIVTLVSKKKLVNRGFLIGPICPIYGFGAIAMILLVGTNSTDILDVFLKSIFICSILEYFTSYFMEKIFNIRWWDYSNKMFNINGRICLETMVPFGILSCIIIYLVHPNVEKIINLLSNDLLIALAIIFIILFLVDNILSTHILLKIKGHIKAERKDNTEKIKKYIDKWIQENSALYRRIVNAFPKFQIYLKNSKNKKK